MIGYKRAGFTFFFLLFLGLGFCGSEDDERWGISFYIEDIPVSSVVLVDEMKEISLLGRALKELRLSIDHRAFFFVRDPYMEIPSVCKKVGGCSYRCANRWIDLPGIIGVEPTAPSEGYKGYMGDEHIFVSRLPSAYSSLRSLIVHEYSHTFNLSHGEEMKKIEEIINEKILEIEGRSKDG